jgi:FixJ family two-component response regulator
MATEIFVVDYDVEARASIARILREEGLQPVLFDSELALFRERALSHASCLIAANEMPILGGAEIQALLHLIGWRTPLILMSASPTTEGVVRAVRAGAVGFISKPVDPPLLLAAVHDAMEINQRNRRELENRETLLARFAQLTDREREVLQYVVAGRLNKQTGASLGVTEKTIKVHRARMMQKLGVRTVPDLIRLMSLVGSPPAVVSRPYRPATWDWNIKDDWVLGDPMLSALYGVDDRGAPLNAFLERIHPHDILQVDATIRHAIESGCGYHARYRVIRGFDERVVVAYGRVFYNDSKVPVRFPGILLEI